MLVRCGVWCAHWRVQIEHSVDLLVKTQSYAILPSGPRTTLLLGMAQANDCEARKLTTVSDYKRALSEVTVMEYGTGGFGLFLACGRTGSKWRLNTADPQCYARLQNHSARQERKFLAQVLLSIGCILGEREDGSTVLASCTLPAPVLMLAALVPSVIDAAKDEDGNLDLYRNQIKKNFWSVQALKGALTGTLEDDSELAAGSRA